MKISRFIKEAHISRASFYLYFRDKKDLFIYMLEELAREAKSMFLEGLSLNGGDFYEAAVWTAGQMNDKKRVEICAELCRRILWESQCLQMLLERVRHSREAGDDKKFLELCWKERDPRRYALLKKEDLEVILTMICNIMIKALSEYALDGFEKEEVLEVMKNQLRILERAMESG